MKQFTSTVSTLLWPRFRAIGSFVLLLPTEQVCLLFEFMILGCKIFDGLLSCLFKFVSAIDFWVTSFALKSSRFIGYTIATGLDREFLLALPCLIRRPSKAASRSKSACSSGFSSQGVRNCSCSLTTVAIHRSLWVGGPKNTSSSSSPLSPLDVEVSFLESNQYLTVQYLALSY